jgi:hypothetical protein
MNMQVSVEDQAKQLGWTPQDQFRGDPEKWVDAETFVEKGKHIMPILQKNNERLQSELAALRQQQERQQQALATAQTALEDLQEKQTAQTQKAVDEARKELKAQIRIASENGDHEALAELTDQLTLMPTKAEAKAPEQRAPEQIPLPPDFVAWQNDNKWFGQDVRKTALANAVGAELRQNGSTLIGRPFWDAVSAEVDKVFNPRPDPDRPGDDKVGGARNGAGGAGGKGYSDLPADAKSACDADIRVKVGEGKRYKTAAEWRAKYAELYFGA